MTPQQYLDIRNNLSADTLPAMHFFFTISGGTPMTLQQFNNCLTMFLRTWGVHVLGQMNAKTFFELDKYFAKYLH